MKILVAVGTRPEIIKMSPIIREILNGGKDELVFIHSGQHYDLLMSGQFISELELPKPLENLEMGAGSQGEQTARAIIGFEKIIQRYKPDLVLVQGDTNTSLACALASVKLGTPVGHVEAGLRSWDRTMPEEINRIMIDHCSEVLLTQHENSALNLVFEGISRKNIAIVGNTVVDACLANLEIAKNKITMKTRELAAGPYCLVTVHRPENTDHSENLQRLVGLLERVPVKAVFPLHPRTRKKLEEFDLLGKLKLVPNLVLLEPVGYFEFLFLLKNARFVLTDSGGVQEEAIILHTPCITLRYNTERPETITAGGNVLAGMDVELAIEYAKRVLDEPAFDKKMRNCANPYGQDVGKKILGVLHAKHESGALRVGKSNFIGKKYPTYQLLSGIEGKVSEFQKDTEVLAVFPDGERNPVYPGGEKVISGRDRVLVKKSL